MTVGKAPKKASDHIPFYRDQGLEYALGSTGSNKVVLTSSFVAAAATQAFDIPASFGVTMANTSYVVLVQVDDGAGATVGSKTTVGFTVGGLTATDVVDVVVIGEIDTQI